MKDYIKNYINKFKYFIYGYFSVSLFILIYDLYEGYVFYGILAFILNIVIFGVLFGILAVFLYWTEKSVNKPSDNNLNN